jgi:uncharacterized membrane protein YraQ (UPF0718 family)
LKEFIHFLVFEGTLLIGLFYLVTFLLVLVRERWASSAMMTSLTTLPLVQGSTYAAVLGGITPFCSCSTVPVFTGMLRSNVRFGIAFTFLLASPLLSEMVVVIMMNFVGLKQTLSFIALALVLPILCGIAFDKLNFAGLLKEGELRGGEIPGYVGTAAEQEPVPFAARLRFAALASKLELREVLPHLALGVLVGGFIYGFVPNDWIMSVQTSVSEPVLIVTMALIGVPLYLNMTTALPIAFALVEKGIGIGPIMALLVAGAGTSLPELILLLKLFKVRLLLAFMAAVTVSAVCMGFFFSYVAPKF